MTFTRTRDWNLIRGVMTHPRLWDAGADDFAPAREAFEPRKEDAIWYVAVTAPTACVAFSELLGLFVFAPQNTICWEIHTRLLPHAWGSQAAAAAREIVPWIFANTACRRIVTSVPAQNRLAIRYAERGGLVKFGVNPASYQKNGVLLDQVLLGISA